MDCDVAKYSQARYDEIAAEIRLVLMRVGWKKDFVAKSVPVIPISGWMGDNLITKSTNMDWWKGQDVVGMDGSKHHVDTLLQALNDLVVLPTRDEASLSDAPCPASTRSRVSVMSSLAVLSRVLCPRVTRPSFSPPTLLPRLALVRSSPLRCTTRTSLRLAPVTTSA